MSLLRNWLRRRHAGKLEEEIQGLIDQGAEQGVISPAEGEMIQSIFEFGQTLAREIMIPRTDMIASDQKAPLREVLDLAIKHGHSRLPIYDGDIDHIVGILHVKDLLSLWGRSSGETLPQEIVRPAHFIPEAKKIGELLKEFRSQKMHLAIVLDEYGGTAGLVALEDIIEEIVGEIQDEYDEEESRIVYLENDAVLVDARLNVEDLGDQLGLKLPRGNYESLGGFIIDMIGRVPQEEECIEFQNLVFTIRSADERKINQVEIKLPQPVNPINSENT